MALDMDAIVLRKFGGPEELKLQRVVKPEPVSQEVLIHVKAFGLNHADMHIRKGEWDLYNPILGFECVGVVEACPNGKFAQGSKVFAIMGGMGLLRPGCYGEYVNVPVDSVTQIESNLSWAQLAAIPLVYASAYTCLFTNLDIHAGESLLIRGATSTIGQAALHLAVDAGVKVTTTTRRMERFEMLKNMGSEQVIIEEDDLHEKLSEDVKFDKILNLVGNRVLLQSTKLINRGGRMVLAGWLGGLSPLSNFNPMLEMEAGVHFSLFNSRELGTPKLPLASIPLQAIIMKLEKSVWNAEPAKVFDYRDIIKAHGLLESHDAGGKIVITR